MAKFRVRFEGSGFVLPQQSGPPVKGFFTTRFVEALDEQEAIRRAADIVHEDLMRALPPDEALRASLTVDEVREDPRLFDQHAPGQGFTWFS